MNSAPRDHCQILHCLLMNKHPSSNAGWPSLHRCIPVCVEECHQGRDCAVCAGTAGQDVARWVWGYVRVSLCIQVFVSKTIKTSLRQMMWCGEWAILFVGTMLNIALYFVVWGVTSHCWHAAFSVTLVCDASCKANFTPAPLLNVTFYDFQQHLSHTLV